jgi:hypothetical protein
VFLLKLDFTSSLALEMNIPCFGCECDKKWVRMDNVWVSMFVREREREGPLQNKCERLQLSDAIGGGVSAGKKYRQLKKKKN